MGQNLPCEMTNQGNQHPFTSNFLLGSFDSKPHEKPAQRFRGGKVPQDRSEGIRRSGADAGRRPSTLAAGVISVEFMGI
jgi:hypothetical protein